MANEWVRIPLHKLTPAPWNYKVRDAFLAEKLEANIRRNGQVENLIVRRLNDSGLWEVVNGNHRLEAFHALKLMSAMCFDLGEIPEVQAKRIALETNETHFEDDPEKLARMVGDIISASPNAAELIATLPYTDSQLDQMRLMNDFDWRAALPPEPDAGEGAPIVKCPACGELFHRHTR
jgi:ParB-like chromosome segregation protein Spo0J